VYHGNQFASEIGAMIIEADGRDDPQKIKGSFEHYCSGPAIEKAYFEKTGKKKSIIEIAKMEDKTSLQVLNEAAHYLAIGLNNIKNIFDPRLVVIGGSLSKISYMINKAIKEMEKMPVKSKMVIEPAKNEHPALLGAYKLFSE